EAHARRRGFFRVHRDEQLELERLLDLVDGHELAGAAEEWIARRCQRERHAKLLGDLVRACLPALAECERRFRRADAHVLAHAERLHASELARGLATEAIRLDVDDHTAAWHVAALGDDRIHRVARGRREHEVGRRERIDPFLPRRLAFDERANARFGAGHRAHATQEVREALQVARLLDERTTHHRWEAEYLGARLTVARDQRGKTG